MKQILLDIIKEFIRMFSKLTIYCEFLRKKKYSFNFAVNTNRTSVIFIVLFSKDILDKLLFIVLVHVSYIG